MTLIRIGGVRLNANIAITEQAHCQGLKHIEALTIMAFPYKTLEIRSFWMEDTISPLDIIFCNAGKIVSIENGEPLSLKYLGNVKTDLVIEVPAGFCERTNIKVGDCVKMEKSIAVIAAEYAQSLKI